MEFHNISKIIAIIRPSIGTIFFSSGVQFNITNQYGRARRPWYYIVRSSITNISDCVQIPSRVGTSDGPRRR